MFKLYIKNPLPFLVIAFITIISTLILWSPFILKSRKINGIKIDLPGFQTVIQQWDGPLYIIPAKTFYDLTKIDIPNQGFILSLPLSAKYFAAHFPIYPLTIKFLSSFFSYPKAMLTSTLIASILLFSFFYYFLKKLKLTSHPLWLTFIFMFITPRFFVIRSVGSPEPLFILLILLSLFFFLNEDYLLAGTMGSLATMTKTPGILLFFAYLLYFIEQYLKTKKLQSKWFWIVLIPIGLLSVFLLYLKQYGDFFAYFHSGDNIHLTFLPFSVFNFQKKWVGTAWLEEIIFFYFLYLMAAFKLFKKESLKPIFYFMVIFFLAIISVEHRDISRYSLPLLPLALIAFEKFFTSKKFLIALIFLLPAIYLYAWNFMAYNIAPISDWGPFL